MQAFVRSGAVDQQDKMETGVGCLASLPALGGQVPTSHPTCACHPVVPAQCLPSACPVRVKPPCGCRYRFPCGVSARGAHRLHNGRRPLTDGMEKDGWRDQVA
ncbi:hypothetical protein B0I35DRAFT_416895 [Stachybotrys elegans]|uniref:Uncharacterized protein n=1 Tax=Stachybotrys elegans TaxID=80388 RepID=A0A8K0SY31_9HYPO|nr:hypothetical protein B0I35DRAFT_416895 [Stachybotrys elegans]